MNDDDLESRTIDECRHQHDWPKWQETIQAELDSLTNRGVFKPIVLTLNDVKPVGYKCVFVRKKNDKNWITRYKTRQVTQGSCRNLRLIMKKYIHQ